MAKERLKSPRLRAFVALELPPEVRGRIDVWGDGELTDPALRRVPPAYLHVTLAFLGWQAEKDVARIAEILQGCAGDAPLMQLLRDPVARPPRGKRPNFFALEVSSPGAVLLQDELASRLEKARFYKPEKRPFWPHVTLARARTEKREGGGRSKRKMPVKRRPGRLPDDLLQPFGAVRLTFYRSILRREGPIYDPLAQIELPAERAPVK
jgi:RNA 2',3'-cyclic 3'-phosphodiesterase